MELTTVELDNRGLQPPEPMLRILDALKALPEGGQVLARMDRAPVFLYPVLDEQGYQHDTQPVGDGSFHVRIWRAADGG